MAPLDRILGNAQPSGAANPSEDADVEVLLPNPAGKSTIPGLVDIAALHMETMPDVPFNELCHRGLSVTSKNWLVKLWRYTIVPTKELYLPFMEKVPTNYLMLTFRTFNRDFDRPNHNADDLACLLRDALMPERGRLHRERSPKLYKRLGMLDIRYLGVPGIINFVDVRTQWFDQAVKQAIADGIKQIVVLAAGYDTRAYRLASPGVKFYEVDLPHASKTKQQLVKELLPRSKYSWPEFVAADLGRVSLTEALAPTSFDPSQRALFMMEGLVYYLTPEAFKQQLESISASAVVGSRLFFDFLHLSTLWGEKFHPGFETLMVAVWNKGEVMYSGVDERPAAVASLVRKFGFQLSQLWTGRQMQSYYLPHLTWDDTRPAVAPYFGYIAAEKVKAPLPVQDAASKKAQ